MPTIVVDGIEMEATPGQLAAAQDTPLLDTTPRVLSRRQLLLALLGAGFITPEEALAAASTGALPAAVQATFAGLGAAEEIGARITWASMTQAERGHPLFGLLVAAGLATEAQVDQLFQLGATL